MPKITDLRYERVRGTLDYDGPLGEEHRTGPLEIYPEYRSRRRFFPLGGPRRDPPYQIEQIYLHIDTDQGLFGTWRLPGGLSMAQCIEGSLRPVLIGENALATERIWDKMYRALIHGRKGETMMAISAVDLALWDLKGRAFNAPVYELLGGPTRESIPCYASMLGYDTTPDRAAERTREMRALGYRGIKWFFGHSHTSGPEGHRQNVELVRAVRQAAGPDMDVMFDCWNSFDVPYVQRLARDTAAYRPRWFEEPVMPDWIDQYAELRRTISTTAISGGEHEYTRWGAKALLDAGAVDVLQMDVIWAGGLTEMLKVAALASAYGIPLIPHCGYRAASHLIAAQALSTCPLQEWLIQSAAVAEFFLKQRCWPKGGTLGLPPGPGLGMELDDTRIGSRETLRV
jgi:L-alanine-DL-glutamate epimerase-like enolase superfamily enzyme